MLCLSGTYVPYLHVVLHCVCVLIVDCIISFNDASITAEEGGEVMIRLNVNNPASEDLTVQVLVQSQPPQPPIDFTFATNSRVSAQIFVLPDDDICCEEDEISVLSINVSSLPDHCVVGDPDSTTLIVEDDSDGEYSSLDHTLECIVRVFLRN